MLLIYHSLPSRLIFALKKDIMTSMRSGGSYHIQREYIKTLRKYIILLRKYTTPITMIHSHYHLINNRLHNSLTPIPNESTMKFPKIHSHVLHHIDSADGCPLSARLAIAIAKRGSKSYQSSSPAATPISHRAPRGFSTNSLRTFLN